MDAAAHFHRILFCILLKYFRRFTWKIRFCNYGSNTIILIVILSFRTIQIYTCYDYLRKYLYLRTFTIYYTPDTSEIIETKSI